MLIVEVCFGDMLAFSFPLKCVMSFLAGLNDAQRRAVDQHEGPLLRLLAPGGNRAHRIAHLIGEHGRPSGDSGRHLHQQGRREMKERLELLGSEAGRVSTASLEHPVAVEQRQLRRASTAKSPKNSGSAPFTRCLRGYPLRHR